MPGGPDDPYKPVILRRVLLRCPAGARGYDKLLQHVMRTGSP